ncbi:hypothetical protein JVT61DRAFT_14928 [Boletus reticuloceps]|uniref:PITH domain-containing protein n=1 Tax=Boletus reticuloceps TaxID=495285 RepID=A0A8I3A2S6_9AGAM|nr:hypothetical protein JVT61DRAFT_14928 [Boletus reticuloceps]
MPDNHHHHHNEGCGHESHDHDHDHDSGDLGPNDNLFPHIDRPHVVALNAVGPGASVIKPWHARMNEQVVRDNKSPILCLSIKTSAVFGIRRRRTILRSLLLKAGPGDQTPQKIALVRVPHIQVHNVLYMPTSFDFRFKFANEPSLDFDDVSDKSPAQEFEVAVGREVGEYARKSNPVITVYEAQANIADHDKVQGTEGAFSTPHT